MEAIHNKGKCAMKWKILDNYSDFDLDEKIKTNSDSDSVSVSDPN